MSPQYRNETLAGPDGPHFTADQPAEDVAPWTEIEPGRFMPRRMRGSFQGRALG